MKLPTVNIRYYNEGNLSSLLKIFNLSEIRGAEFSNRPNKLLTIMETKCEIIEAIRNPKYESNNYLSIVAPSRLEEGFINIAMEIVKSSPQIILTVFIELMSMFAVSSTPRVKAIPIQPLGRPLLDSLIYSKTLFKS